MGFSYMCFERIYLWLMLIKFNKGVFTMVAINEKRKTWMILVAAGVFLLGLGLFGGVTMARISGGHFEMMAGMHSTGKGMSGSDMSQVMANMEGMMAEMHPDIPAETRTNLLEKCRSIMASIDQHHEQGR